MKKRALTTIVLSLLACFILAGCKKETTPPVPQKPDTAKESSKEQEADTKEPDLKEPEKEEAPSEEAPEESVEAAPDAASSDTDDGIFARAFKESRVYNNGSYFVTIDNKVYFRNIRPDSMDKGATFGSFLTQEWTPTECPLITYDLDTCEWEETGKITGIGKLYACPKGFYIGEMNPNNYDSYCTDLYDPLTGETEVYCKGEPLGVSDSGELLAVERYGSQNINTVLLKDGNDVITLGGENIYYEYCGFSGENLIVIYHTANDDLILCSVDEYGDITELGTIDNASGYGYPEPKQLETMKGEIYLTLGYYEGTGHFLSNWETYNAVPGLKGSLRVVTEGKDNYYEEREDEEGPENAVPFVCFDTGDNLFYSLHTPYKAYMGDDKNSNDLYYYNDIYEECCLVKDFIKNEYTEKRQIIQDITSTIDTVFVIYADAEEDSEYDIGWRTGYRMTGFHICAIPYGYGHEDENGLAKEIIYFDDTKKGSGGN